MSILQGMANAALMHRRMSTTDRLENAITAFVCLDIFHMLSTRLADAHQVPHDTLFFAHTTLQHLLELCGSIVIICGTIEKDSCILIHRLTELGIEVWFGGARGQMPSAQLSVRDYMTCQARAMRRHLHQTAVHLTEDDPSLSQDSPFVHLRITGYARKCVSNPITPRQGADTTYVGHSALNRNFNKEKIEHANQSI